MIKVINKLGERLKASTLNNLIIQYEVRQANLTRSMVLTGACFPLSVILFLFYYLNMESENSATIEWTRQVISIDLIAGTIILVLFFLTYFKYKKKEHKDFIGGILPDVVFMVIAIWGVLSSVLEQSVTSSIIEFVLACAACSLCLLIRPWRLLLYLSLIFLLFYAGILYAQTDHKIRIFNIANGFCAVVICFGLSLMQWRNHMIRFRQNRKIQEQNKALENNYSDLLLSSEELSRANSSKDKFFAILAHDLRGPISSTLALTDLLEEGFFETDESERKRMYRLLQSSLDTTAKLLENVLLWSRNQTGSINFNPVEVNLYEVIQNSKSFLQIVAAQKDIQVFNTVDKGVHILADVDMINTIFRNLISNAIKFTPNFGEVEIGSEYYYDQKDKTSFVKISVCDHGVGMTQETLNGLFKIDRKVLFPGTNNETGTGLGLILCHDFVQKHGGTIEVKSKQGEGTIFMIKLPVPGQISAEGKHSKKAQNISISNL